MGGGLGSLDPLGAVNPASISDLNTVTVLATSGTSFRNYTFGGDTVSGLHDTRFPYAIAGGPIPSSNFTLAVSYSSYLDRTYDLSAADSVGLRGSRVAVTDRIASDGGVADVRGALAWSDRSHHLSLGIGAHLFSGSAKLLATRQFSDSAYRTYNEQGEEQMGSAGVSVGALVRVGSAIHLAAAARAENNLSLTIDSTEVAQVHLPMALTGGLMISPSDALRWATTVTFQNWSRARVDSATIGGAVFDTWEVGSGLELGAGSALFPLRVGARYSQLPFSPSTTQAHELAFSAGTGRAFAHGRGLLDATVERVLRDGAGVTERAWQLAFSLTVRP
jgi:hypothetical protein